MCTGAGRTKFAKLDAMAVRSLTDAELINMLQAAHAAAAAATAAPPQQQPGAPAVPPPPPPPPAVALSPPPSSRAAAPPPDALHGGLGCRGGPSSPDGGCNNCILHTRAEGLVPKVMMGGMGKGGGLPAWYCPSKLELTAYNNRARDQHGYRLLPACHCVCNTHTACHTWSLPWPTHTDGAYA